MGKRAETGIFREYLLQIGAVNAGVKGDRFRKIVWVFILNTKASTVS